MFTLDELVEQFDIAKCSKAGARFDYQKGIWFNHEYILKKSDEEIAELFAPIVAGNGVEESMERVELADVIEGIDDFSIENQEKVVMEWVESKGYKLGDVMNAFRLALVGIGKGPGMFDITAFLGKEETLRRLRRAIKAIPAGV